MNEKYISAQMTIDIHDYSIVDDLIRILSRIEGVGNVSVKKTYFESPEFYEDIDAAEEEIANGQGTRINSKEELDALFS